VLVSESLSSRPNISTIYQIVFLREKFLEFILAIAKETYFTILVEKIALLVWNLRVQLVF
jgi:hypothetical protein